ncbi:MAG: glycine--tRNA ligase subunit beta [Rhodospirillales bacterium]
MPELLLELLSEEIPARMQARAAEDLKRLVCEGLKAAGLDFTKAESYATPRRLTLVVDGLPKKTPSGREEKRGPRVSAPEKAVAGFKGSLPAGTPIEERETEKGTFLFAVVESESKPTAAVLIAVIHKTLDAFPWLKSMRWGTTSFYWIRPLEGILAIFNGETLDGQIIISNYNYVLDEKTPSFKITEPMQFHSLTTGHRFLSSEIIKPKDFTDYKEKLRKAYVVLDASERRAIIERDAEKLAQKENLTVKLDPGLLDEVTGLVEWPVVLMGSIDSEFMELPPEVLSTTMAANQKYFSTLDAGGKLAPKFIVVANMETADKGKAIIAGNERVLRARLADARFFWDQDRKATLESRVPKLEHLVFHAKLGTIAQKVSRLQALVAKLAPAVPGCDTASAEQAAFLCKADLVSEMVFEFPELQGVMGRYYALQESVRADVAAAISEHYSPLGPNDTCPSAPLGVAVALADKIDTLVGFWGIGETPTGSKDPYALRRAALGVIRLIVENKLRLPLLETFKHSAALYGNGIIRDDFESNELLVFFADRLKVHLREKGVRHDLVSAVFALGGEDDLVRLLARVEALQGFLATDDGANLLTAYKRASNIVAIEEKKDKASYTGEPESGLLRESEEQVLFEALAETRANITVSLDKEDFAGAMGFLALLRLPVDAFFDRVTVNCDDAALRKNRLKLLSLIRTAMGQVADFSRIEG